MEFPVVTGDVTDQAVDAVVVNLFSGVKDPGGATGAVDRALGGLISKLIEAGEIKGKSGEITVLHTLDNSYTGFRPDRVIVAGLGKREEFDLDEVRAVSAGVARRLRALGVRNAATVTHGAGIGGMDPAACAEALAEGSVLGLYKFDKYKTGSEEQDDGDSEIESLAIIEIDRERIHALQSGVATAGALAAAATLARDLVNEPPNQMSPTRLAEVARSVADETGGLECEVLDRPEIERLGMGAFLGVAQGSHEPPKLIRLDYVGDPDDPDNNLWFVGKGITFDSGGLSLKPSSGMEQMKSDMAGGAAAIAALQAVARLKPKINVTALCLGTENMPGGGAQRVSDIVTSMSGKTIEVLNTDAEGRLTLADALEYAKQHGARRIVDIATLTGGIVVALGRGNSGAFSNDDTLVEAVIAAGKARGEPVWRLPLDKVSKKQNRSKIADIKNTGGRPAQAATGAHFIAEFAGDTPWVHLDIAGTAMIDSTTGWKVGGATGVPARTLVQLALDLARDR